MAPKTLVAYYSLTGNTEAAAKAIAMEKHADLQKIEDANAKKSNWWLMIKGGFAAVRKKREPIKPLSVDVNAYETIYLGAPVWGNNPPPAVNTFIDQTNFTGKQVILFATMGGQNGKTMLGHMKTMVEARGGKVIDSFAISSGHKSKERIAEETKAYIEKN